MTYDPNAGTPPMGHMEQKPSSKKWWMFGGCGCVVVLLLCGGGVLGMFLWVGKPLMDLMNENLTLARSSVAIQEALGDPIELDENPAVANEAVEGRPVVILTYQVKGSDASGEVVIRATMEEDFSWSRESMLLILEDGTEIDVDPDAELDLDIDTGDDTSEE